MALKLKYTDEHGILHINMSPSASPRLGGRQSPSGPRPPVESEASERTEGSEKTEDSEKTEIADPKFDTINNRFSNYDLFGGKYDVESGEVRSLFRSRYNSIEEELANTPYAFATERSLRLNATSPLLDITIKHLGESPSKDIEDDRFFNRSDLFGPQIDFETSIKTSDEDESPAFTVTQLIHAQDRYFDLSARQIVDSPRTEDRTLDKSGIEKTVKSVKSFRVKSEPNSARKDRVKLSSGSTVSSRVGVKGRGVPQGVLKSQPKVLPKAVKEEKNEAFEVLEQVLVKSPVKSSTESVAVSTPVVQTPKRKREKSFAIIAETVSRPSSPKSLPVEIQREKISPFRGRGFRQETSRHTTPRTSAANSRSTSPRPRRRTSSLSGIDKMATAALPPPPPPVLNISRPHSPRNFLKENIEEVRELSELNREKHEAEAEQKRLEEEAALLKEMGLLDKNGKSDAIRSVVCSRNASRSNSPNKIKLRSRSNSPSAKVQPPAILHFENISAENSEYINDDDGMSPVTHKSRVRSVSRSQPQSNDGSPKHSKIPKRQNSVSPARKEPSNSRKLENNLNKNQRFISNSTSSIHETIRIGSQSHDKRNMSKSTQLLNIAPAHIKGKPPISPGRGGPPPSNRAINAKRLSPIVGTPNKSPVEDNKPGSARTPTKPSPVARKPVKTASNTPATSRLNSRQPSRNISRDTSPEKRTTLAKTSSTRTTTKPVTRAASTKNLQKPTVPKTEPKKPINRTNSMKSLTRTPSTKTLNEKPPLLKKRDSKKDLKAQSTSKIDEIGAKKERETLKSGKKSPVKTDKGKDVTDKSTTKPSAKGSKKEKTLANEELKKSTESTAVGGDEVSTQDNETQYDKISNEKGDLVILTKKNIVSMTTAAITSQPLEVVTKVTNQLPVTLEKAREKGIFERHSSKDSLAPKEDDQSKSDDKKEGSKEKHEEEKSESQKAKTQASTSKTTAAYFSEDNVKLKPLLPPYNNPQVERVKQKIDDILKTPEVSTEHIMNTPTPPPKLKTFKNLADKTKNEIKEKKDSKDETTNKFMDLKEQMEKQKEKTTEEIRTEATKIVESIITPVEEPKEIEKPSKPKEEGKKEIEPIVMVVNEKNSSSKKSDVVEKMTETLVKGEPEVEVQSSNMSTPGVEKITLQNKMADSNGSDKSNQSNGGFPQSTSTTPKPPARTKKDAKEDSKTNDSKETSPEAQKPQSFGQKFMGKCKKCCACCVKPEDDEKEAKDVEAPVGGKEKKRFLGGLNCFRKEEKLERDMERAAGKAASIEFESETKRKRRFRDVMCACCGSRRRVSDVTTPPPHLGDVTAPSIVGEGGCCAGKRDVERRDSILSDGPPATCCNNRLFTWMRGACRRNQMSEELSASRRQSLFSKNKSLSPTLPPEDTRTKLDPSLVEHTSVMRGAIPVLPIVLAYLCLICNVLIPGLGTIFSGMFCLCFGIPRFGVHDGAKHRIGSFFINLLVGCGQLFTVLFCLVGWGWSIWWGVIMIKISRKYRKLKAEEAAEEAESAPPVTANNHTRA